MMLHLTDTTNTHDNITVQFMCWLVYSSYVIRFIYLPHRAQLSLALRSPPVVSCVSFTLDHSLRLLTRQFSNESEEMADRTLRETTHFVKVIII